MLEQSEGFQNHDSRRQGWCVLPREGPEERKVDEGNTVKPNVFCEDLLATSLFQTAFWTILNNSTILEHSLQFLNS